MLKKKSLG